MTTRGVPRPRRAIGDGRVLAHLDAEDAGRAQDDRGQVVLLVEVEPVGRPEPVAQRTADPARAGRRADDGERLEGEPERSRRGTLADHHVEGVVLHRRVEDLLDGPVQAMDLVDEQDVVVVEGGQDRGQVAGPLDRRAAGVADVDAELAGDDRGQGGLAEAGRAVQQDVIGGFTPPPRRRQQHREVGLDLALADVFGQAVGPERALDRLVRLVQEVRREDPGSVVRHCRQSTTRFRPYRTFVLYWIGVLARPAP